MLFKNLRLSGRIGRAQSLLIKGKYSEAKVFLEDILSLDPPDYLELSALIQKGKAEYHLGSEIEALKSCKKAVEIYKTFPQQEPITKHNKVIGQAIKFIEIINGNKT